MTVGIHLPMRQGAARDYRRPLTEPTMELLLQVLQLRDAVETRAAQEHGRLPDGGALLRWAAVKLENLGLRCASFESNRLPHKEPTATLHTLKIVAECPLKGESSLIVEWP